MAGQLVTIVSQLSAQVLAVSDANEEKGTPIIQWPYGGNASEQWVVLPLPGSPEVFEIVSLLSGQVLAVGNDSKDEGKPIVQWPYNDPHGNKESRQWRIVTVADGLKKIVSLLSGLALAVADDSKDKGKPIVQWPYDDPRGNKESRQWRIKPLDL
jgi:hypothetical protein